MKLYISPGREADAVVKMALEVAFGCTLPRDVSLWPSGLRDTWNGFATADDCPDLRDADGFVNVGELARAYLIHRLAAVERAAAANQVAAEAREAQHVG